MSIQDKDCVLTSKGYAVKKSFLTEIQTQGLRSELTVAPKVMDKFQKDVQNFPIYSESKTRFYVPRHWGIKKFGEPEVNIVSEGLAFPETITFSTKFPPHEFQKEIIETFIQKGANGLICVPCGYGKTFMALNIAVKLKRRFLIVVDKEFLMNQWKSEIENFIQGARVGILQSNKVQIDAEKYDITICMIQTICRREFPSDFFDQYGFTIFDECHHLGAAYFCQALKKIQTKYMLGLSATPDREDGLSVVFEHHLGDPVYKVTKRAPDKEAIVKAVWFDSEDPIYKDVPVNWRGEPITAKLLNQVAEFEPRNNKIMALIDEYAMDPDRYILILSDRISQLEWFEKALNEWPTKYVHGYYIGGMKQSKLDHNADKCQILLATYQMASEAFSVKKLNTVILATPRKNVEQSTGRIFRQRIDERKVAPHIIDIIDSHDCHKRRWFVRQKFYKECEYTFQHINKPKKVVEKVEANEHGCLLKLPIVTSE
jgi:superfamily II DNA or RNA helicase